MGFIEIFLIGIGLSMDAFAVSVCKGLSMHRINYGYALVIALFFGVFQGLMPVIGWALGSTLSGYVTAIDHWIAFVLLAAVGAKMLWDALHEECEGCEPDDGKLDVRELFALAIATSIDALAVGIGFSFLQINIAEATLIIGITTFCLSIIGVVVGNRFGARFEKPAQIVGGVVLIVIGLKILLEHLGIIAF